MLAVQKADNEGYPWRNQVALPGGHIDEADSSPLDAAFRELREELNIPREQVRLINSLGHFQTINNKDIEVFVGRWDGEGPVRYDPNEIARVLKIPLSSLFQIHLDKNFHGRLPDVHELIYPYIDTEIWGVTGKIVHNLLEKLYPLYANK
jgi:8-oxo-dGTP pyrophosphatase MutT (NUDIX family)